MSVVQKQDIVPPLAIVGILHSQWAGYALRAAVELKLFQPLAENPKTAEEVAKELKTNEQGTRLLLDAMVGITLLKKEANKYSLTEVAKQYLVAGSPLYMGQYIILSGEIYKRWAELCLVF